MTLEERVNDLGRRLGDLVRKPVKSPSEVEEMLRVQEAFSDALRQQAQPLIEEIARVGIQIKSEWDFVNTSASYSEAIPVLVSHLSKPYHRRIREGIVRALAVKEAKGVANKAVMEEYLKLPKESPDQPWLFHYRWAFGNTMSVIVTKDDLDQLIDIVSDESNGESRTGFIVALAKIKSPKAIEILHQLEKDKNKIVAEWAKKMLTRKATARQRKAGKQN